LNSSVLSCRATVLMVGQQELNVALKNLPYQLPDQE